MTKADLLKRLEPMGDDKVIVFVDRHGGWANLEDIIEKQCQIELTIEEAPLFSDGH